MIDGFEIHHTRKERNMLPELTEEQRRANLAKSRAARAHRTEVLDEVRDGSRTVADVLAMVPGDDAVARMKVSALVKAVPGIGAARAGKAMQRLRIAENRRVKGLGPRQRAALVEMFG